MATVDTTVQQPLAGASASMRRLTAAEAQRLRESMAQRVGDVARGAISQPRVRILDGRYDAFDNVIVLKAVHYTYDDNGVVTNEREEEIYYEVTSLQAYKNAEQNSPIQVLGAKTSAAMQKVLGPMIESFKALSDASHLVDRPLDTERARAEADGLESTVGATFKTVAFSASEAPPATEEDGVAPAPPPPSMTIVDQFVTQDGVTMPILGPHCYGAGNHFSVSNPKVLHDVLESSNWQDLIQPAEQELAKGAGAVRQHAFTFISPTRAARAEKMAQVTNILLGTSISREGNRESVTSFMNSLRADVEEIADQQELLYERIVELEAQFERLGALCESGTPMPAEKLAGFQRHHTSLKKYIQDLHTQYAQLEKSKQKRLTLLIFNAESKLETQFNAVGNSPYGRNLSEQWHDTLYHQGLLKVRFPVNEGQEDYYTECQHALLRELGYPIQRDVYRDQINNADEIIDSLQRNLALPPDAAISRRRPQVPPRPPGGHRPPPQFHADPAQLRRHREAETPVSQRTSRSNSDADSRLPNFQPAGNIDAGDVIRPRSVPLRPTSDATVDDQNQVRPQSVPLRSGSRTADVRRPHTATPTLSSARSTPASEVNEDDQDRHASPVLGGRGSAFSRASSTGLRAESPETTGQVDHTDGQIDRTRSYSPPEIGEHLADIMSRLGMDEDDNEDESRVSTPASDVVQTPVISGPSPQLGQRRGAPQQLQSPPPTVTSATIDSGRRTPPVDHRPLPSQRIRTPLRQRNRRREEEVAPPLHARAHQRVRTSPTSQQELHRTLRRQRHASRGISYGAQVQHRDPLSAVFLDEHYKLSQTAQD